MFIYNYFINKFNKKDPNIRYSGLFNIFDFDYFIKNGVLP